MPPIVSSVDSGRRADWILPDLACYNVAASAASAVLGSFARVVVPMDETRSSLIQRVRDLGDVDGWNEFDRFYRPMLMRYARGRGLAADDAEEIAQQCMTAIVNQIGKFERHRSFRGWLRGMVDHKVSDLFASRYRHRRADTAMLEGAADTSTSTGALWEEEWNESHLHALLGDLRNSFAEHTLKAFELYVVCSYAVADICRLLDMTPNQVYVAKNRVINHIKKNFGDTLDSMYGVWP